MSDLKHVPIADIKEGKRFREDYAGLDELKKAIEEKGLLQPITLDQNLNLLAGGRRFRAARELGHTTIPALIRESSGELDLREVELMENLQRVDLSWQEKANLTREIDRLFKEKHGRRWSGRKTAAVMGKAIGGVSMDLQLAEAMKAVPQLATCKTADDARKMLKKAHERVQVNKDVKAQEKRMEQLTHTQYANDHYRIGDAFASMTQIYNDYVEEGRASNIKLLEVDPPYAIDLAQVKRGNKAAVDYNEVDEQDYLGWLRELAALTYNIAAPNSFLVFWFGPTWHTQTYAALSNSGWQVDDIPCIWNKGDGQTNQPQYYMARSYEPFFLARKGKPALARQGRSNVFNYKPMPQASKWHPTQRPLALMQEILTTVAHPGTICCSPFLGSGTTLLAAYKSTMHCFGWDLSEMYKNRFLLEVEKMEKGGEFS